MALPDFRRRDRDGWRESIPVRKVNTSHAAPIERGEQQSRSRLAPPEISSSRPGAFAQTGKEERRESVVSRKSARVEGRARLAPTRHRVLDGGFLGGGGGAGGGPMPTPPPPTHTGAPARARGSTASAGPAADACGRIPRPAPGRMGRPSGRLSTAIHYRAPPEKVHRVHPRREGERGVRDVASLSLRASGGYESKCSRRGGGMGVGWKSDEMDEIVHLRHSSSASPRLRGGVDSPVESSAPWKYR